LYFRVNRYLRASFCALAGLAVTAMDSGVAPESSGVAPVAPGTKLATGSQQKLAPLPSLANPLILSPQDQAIYRDIFAAQTVGKWKEADRLIAQLQNDLLLGHLMFRRYMHPTKYRSRYAELKGWLAANADHPGAARLYKLARKRRGSAGYPRRPVPSNPWANGRAKLAPVKAAPVRLARDDRRAVASVESRLKREIRRSRPERAERYLWAFERRGLFNDIQFDKWLAEVAKIHLFKGNDSKALALASFAADRSGAELYSPGWIAGLAAWRLGDCATAAQHFESSAKSKGAGPWTRSAALFWAARANLVCQQPQRVDALLLQAARDQETFYGLLAARQLGIEPDLDWSLPQLSTEQYAGLAVLPGVRRAVALNEIGQYDLADQELRLVWGRQNADLREPLLALAARLNLPATQMAMARSAPEGATVSHSLLYPVPDWQPEGGFSVDRAILFAIMRQESLFRPRARSSVGAMGLMQVMPATAGFLEKDRSLRWSNKWKLYQPAFNMRLSQEYIHLLLSYKSTEANLFKFATAYNGGPGNLARWERKMDYANDPLFFIETIPARQTRIYIERIFANMWIYRMRLGQPVPSMDAVAAGAWPPLERLDPETIDLAEAEKQLSRHAKN
jgi:soluble lytic murein transglycosylase-like protein